MIPVLYELVSGGRVWEANLKAEMVGQTDQGSYLGLRFFSFVRGHLNQKAAAWSDRGEGL